MSTIKSVKKPTNEFVIRARKRKLVKKIILMCVILFIGIILFITKSKVFIIKKISILGNPIMSGEDVKEKTQYLIGENIFFMKTSDIIKAAEQNPYVKTVEISKAYPRQVNIKITEKQGIFCSEKDGQYYIFSDKGVLLEKADNIDNRNLIQILGLDEHVGSLELGDSVGTNQRMINVLEVFSQIEEVNPTNYKIDSIDLSDFMNIKVYIGGVEGRLGNDENIPDKMNKLMHIVENTEIGIEKGYVDVGFDGSPIYYKEEVKNEEGNIKNEGV